MLIIKLAGVAGGGGIATQLPTDKRCQGWRIRQGKAESHCPRAVPSMNERSIVKCLDISEVENPALEVEKGLPFSYEKAVLTPRGWSSMIDGNNEVAVNHSCYTRLIKRGEAGELVQPLGVACSASFGGDVKSLQLY